MTTAFGFRVKICGVRKLSDLQAAADAGADAVGLNFHPPSVRYLPEDKRRGELAEAARELGLRTVGVFVNEPIPSLRRVADELQLSAVQLHGDESLDDAQRLLDESLPVIRAIRLPTDPLAPSDIDHRVAPWQQAGCGILLDADAGGSFGGVGHRLDWSGIGRWAADAPFRWMLAGGLTPETLGIAIKQACPFGVDVASGVEQPRGIKNKALIEAFCRTAHSLPPTD